jgi:tryptophan-rich sensory protein
VSIDAFAHSRSSDPRSGASDWIGLAAWLALTFAGAAVGAVASLNAREFYALLTKPAWAPPGWLFGPVWSALYLLMGIAAWLVWRARPATEGGAAIVRRRGLQLYVIQLALNALWTWLFFAWRQGAWAFAEIVLLWLIIVLTVRQFARVHAAAAWLLAPYIAWVSFATALTWAVWNGNPGRL